MKRVLIGLLVVSLVLWTVSIAFAAGFSDTKGTKYEASVETLTTLGLLTGFPDGTFRPGDTITRAQFCAVAVRAMGLGNAAEYAAGATVFADVPATHWAAGYINIAVDQGIAKGYSDGTFKPEAPVTYVEALAMLVRVLGYEPAVKGTWPTNYLVKSFELGMSKGVSFAASAPATRGDVALFVDNCLGIDLMMQVSVGDEVRYEIQEGVTLLDERLGYATVSGLVVETGDVLNSTLDSDEVDIFDGEDLLTYDVAKGLDLTPWLGMEVKAWLDGETILLAKKTTSDKDIYYDTIDEVNLAGDEITLTDLDDTYDLADDAVIYWNFLHEPSANPVSDDWAGAEVTVVLDEDDVIVSLLAIQFEGSYLIEDTDVDDDEVYVITSGGGGKKFDLEKYDIAKFVKDGAELDIEDLVAWDVAHYAEYGLNGDPAVNNEILYFELVDEKVSGEVDEIGLDASDNVVVTVNGKDYTEDADATYSTDDNKNLAAVTEAAVGAFAGEKVKVYLDKYGDLRHIVGDLEEAEAEATIGVVVGNFYKFDIGGGDFQYFVKIFTTEGKKVRYEWDEDTHFTAWDLINANDVGADLDADNLDDDAGIATLNGVLDATTVVSFSLASDGLLADLEEYIFEHPDEDVPQSDINDTYNTIKLGGAKYKGTASTVIFDGKTGEEDVLTWDTFEDIEIADGTLNGLRGYRDGDTTVDIIYFDSTEGVSYPGVAEEGIVLKRLATVDGTAFKVLVEDETGQYLAEDLLAGDLIALDDENFGTDGNLLTDIDVGELVSFELDSAAENFTLLEELDGAFQWDADDSGVVDPDETFQFAWINEGGIDEELMIISIRCDEDKDTYTDDDFDIVLTDDTIVYDVSGSPLALGSFSDLEEDMEIQFFTSEGLVTFVKIIE